MKEIVAALNAAYKECGYVQKAGKNKEQGYKFAGEADFIEAVRPVLLRHGIIVYPSSYKQIAAENYLTKSGSRMNRIVAEYGFTFAHTSGEHINVVAVGEGCDTSDKASPKAATIALKYALRQALLIETGDDPDKETPEERSTQVRVEPTVAQRTQAAIDSANKLVGLAQMAGDGEEALAAFREDNADMIARCTKYPEAEAILQAANLA